MGKMIVTTVETRRVENTRKFGGKRFQRFAWSRKECGNILAKVLNIG